MKTRISTTFFKKGIRENTFLNYNFFWSLHSRGIFQSVNVKIFRNNSQVLRKKLSEKSDNPNLYPQQEFVNYCKLESLPERQVSIKLPKMISR